MTFAELYAFSKKTLYDAHNESFIFDSCCIMEKFLGINRQDLITLGSNIPNVKQEEDFISAVKKRSSGYPLQYIIGKWEFMGNELFVGEGVLIPRDDTEVVVNTCIKYLKNKENPIVVDLCSGTGAIAITVAKIFPNAKVYAVELSKDAFSYLEKNIRHNDVKNVIAVNDDISKCYGNFLDNTFDIIISNPPYVKSNVIPLLQTEIQNEPVMALDGGKDGLNFYRIISKNWISKLKNGGAIALEIGEEQAKFVSMMLDVQEICYIEVKRDIQNLDRAIFGLKKK